MDFLKALFESGAITWEQFSAGVTAKGFKLADLSKGDYVDKNKYEDAVSSRDTRITELSNQITTRDTDIANLKKNLEDGTKDSSAKVADLTNQLAKLQGDYTSAKADYEAKLNKQAYEFAVKEYAGSKKFTSNAAKRDFINEMISANLKIKDNALVGVDEFVEKYSKENADAFVVENPVPEPKPDPKPTFIQPTPTTPSPAGEDNPFTKAFNFTAVR